jgi:hypothetical protein
MNYKRQSPETTDKDAERWVQEGYDRTLEGKEPSRADEFVDRMFWRNRCDDHDHYQRIGEQAADRTIERAAGKKR